MARAQVWALAATLAAPLAALAAGAAAAGPAEPTSAPAPTLKVGDSWTYDSVVERGTTGFGEGVYVAQVDDLRDDGMILGVKRQGAPQAPQDQERGLDWSERRLVDGRPVTGERPYVFPLAVGRTWETDYDDPSRHGLQTSAHVHRTYKVTGWEDVTTPAGTFHCLRIEAHGTLKAEIAASTGGVGGVQSAAGESTALVHTQSTPAHVNYATTYMRTDYAPAVQSFVKSVQENYDSSGVRFYRQTRTLQSYKLAP